MTPPPDALLFDIMSTVVYDPFAVELPAFFNLSMRELLAQKHPTAWQDFERGAIDEATFWRMFFLDGRQVDHERLSQVMIDAYRFEPGMEALLQELLDAGVAMHALSNYPSWYERIERKLKLSRFMSWRFVSCHTGVRKPEPQAYLGAARALGLSPERCLLIDDRRVNCQAAEALGMRAVRYTDAASLRAALIARGAL